ncbi:MAG: exo-alpha-sialidase, partial [Acidobacteria bacterium]|nr:exo-alpha-sialidase [Acidobacteriota bacterium]
MRWLCLVAATTVAAAACGAAEPPGKAERVDLHMIWNAAPHNAFTDLVRLKDRWFCVFREGAGHISHDGKLRVITSADGDTWASAALLGAPGELPDLRDPKITVTPDGRLMLTGAAALRTTSPSRHQTYAWFSSDGKDWTAPVAIGEPDVWLWRVTWHKGVAWGVGYGTAGADFVRLYRSTDGRRFEAVVKRLFDQGSPNEASLVFLDDDTCLCLLRRDGKPNTAMLGTARPPYTAWTWKDLGVQIGGPRLIRLTDGRLVAAGRRYDGS